jgi:hypothetical protein
MAKLNNTELPVSENTTWGQMINLVFTTMAWASGVSPSAAYLLLTKDETDGFVRMARQITNRDEFTAVLMLASVTQYRLDELKIPVKVTAEPGEDFQTLAFSFRPVLE